MTSVTDATLSLSDYLALATPVATWTLAPSAAKPIRDGDTIRLDYPAGFDISGVATDGSGFTQISGFDPDTIAYDIAIAGQRLTLSMASSGPNPLAALTIGTFTIAGVVNASAGSYAGSGFLISTNRDNTAGTTTISNGPVVITGGATAPSVTTQAATAITATTARLPAIVTTNGADITACTITYGTAADLAGGTTTTVTSPALPIADPATNTAVYLDVTGLAPETRYYYRVNATNSADTTNGSILSFVATVSARYRVGAGGNFNADANWSLTPGGVGGATAPQYTNAVYVNASATGTITCTAAVAVASIDYTGFTGTVDAGTQTFACYGNITHASGMTFTGLYASANFCGSGTMSITLNGKQFPCDGTLTITGGANVVLNDAWSQASQLMSLIEGTLNTNGASFTQRQLIDDNRTGSTTMTFGTSTVKIWDAFKRTNSTTMNSSNADLIMQPDIDFVIAQMGTCTWKSWTFLKGTDTGTEATITGVITVTGNLAFAPDVINAIGSAAITAASVSGGTVGHLALVTMTSGSLTATGQFNAQYLGLTNVPLSGVTPGYAINSEDYGGNTNWLFGIGGGNVRNTAALVAAGVLGGSPTGVRQLTISGGVQIDTPIGVAATVPRQTNTQGDGLAIPGGFGVWPAATNLTINGNATTNTTGITDHSSTTTRVTSGVVKFGSTAFNVVSGNAAANEGPDQAVNGGAGSTAYTVSAWVWLVSGAATVRAALYDTIAGKQGGTPVVLTTTPQRVTVSATSGVLGLNVASYIETTVQQAGTWRIGGWKAETGSIDTPYIETDGGTATRTAGRVQMPVAGAFTPAQLWVAAMVTPGYANTALATISDRRIVSWRDASGNWRELIFSNTGAGQLQSLAATAFSGTAAVQNVTFSANTAHLAIGAWRQSGTSVLTKNSWDGAAFTAEGSAVLAVPTMGEANIEIGNLQPGSPNQTLGGTFPWLVFGKGVPTDADAVLMNSWGDTVPSLNQIAMLSAGSQPTALINCKTADYTLLPGYFS